MNGVSSEDLDVSGGDQGGRILILMVHSRVGGNPRGAQRSRPNPDCKGCTDALGNGPELNGLEPPVPTLHMPIQRLCN